MNPESWIPDSFLCLGVFSPNPVVIHGERVECGVGEVFKTTRWKATTPQGRKFRSVFEFMRENLKQTWYTWGAEQSCFAKKKLVRKNTQDAIVENESLKFEIPRSCVRTTLWTFFHPVLGWLASQNIQKILSSCRFFFWRGNGQIWKKNHRPSTIQSEVVNVFWRLDFRKITSCFVG